ncbi:MAG TPA: hypothetical protein VGN64_02180 [Dyadobacter sp.]|jgi:hypothetical protein|nr:hypothetical protein [Dyadobacter sp.]
MKQLNDIQISLLRMFDREIPDEEVLEIKKYLSIILVKGYLKRLTVW